MRKPLLLFLLTLLLCGIAIFLSACQSPPTAVETPAADQELTVVTSFYPIYIATINITKEVPGVRVVNLTQTTAGCLHDYQLTPEDLKTLAGAQIFIINGAGMESFVDKVINQLPALQVIDASQGIPLIEGDHEENNPHVWVSITHAIEQVETISRQLAALDPEHAHRYTANAADYIKKLEELKARMHQALDGITQRDIITFHEAFSYFAREFDLNVAAVIVQEPNSEPSAAELAATIELVQQSGINALFAEPQYSSRAAETIARESGAKIYTLDPVVSGPMEADAYLTIMEQNLLTLQEALQ